ncbi:MAG: Lrp/AsnC family transcriptional regulator [Acidobacteriaceae bacterium]|nr:Lrp/AsnC family transcriptional regulator [Acidobacteriaceae bacterium]
MAIYRKDRAQSEQDSHNSSSAETEEIDREILRVLQQNGRASNAAVGKAVGLSASAVSRRIAAMERRKIIKGYRAIVSDNKVGIGLFAFVRVRIDRQTANAMQSFEQKARRLAAISFCYLMAGDFDYLLLVKVADMAEYERLHQQELSRLPGVQRIESSFALREVLGIL